MSTELKISGVSALLFTLYFKLVNNFKTKKIENESV
jgi:hypothetical protein